MKRRIPKPIDDLDVPYAAPVSTKAELIRRVAAHLQSELEKEGALDARTARCQAGLPNRNGVAVVVGQSKEDLKTKTLAPRKTKKPGNSSRFGLLILTAGLMLGPGRIAHAQQEIDIVKDFIPGSTKPIPVSISGFSGEAAEVIQFDLYVQGFTFTAPDAAQYAISGSNDGNVQGRVVDQISKQTKLSRGYSGAALRRQAHAFADDVVLAITGKKGIAQTKIAFKVDTGQNSEIYIADFDGSNAQAITHDNTIVAAPAWSPGRLGVFYTSYKLGNPDIFFHDLSTGQRQAVARYSGMNSGAAVSPDGTKVAMILSKGGSPDVYVADVDGSNLKQLTKTKEDESSPCWSGDGKWICFATKFEGRETSRRVLAKVPATGGDVQRIPTSGVLSPSEPDWSPDNKWIVFTAQMGDFNVCVVPSGGGTATVLATGEDPSWAAKFADGDFRAQVRRAACALFA